MTSLEELTEEQYRVLLLFRRALRHYLRWSAREADRLGLTPQQHQLLLAVRAYPGPVPPSVGDIAHELMIRHHSAVELVTRVEAAGLLCRQVDRADQRVMRLRLTERGRTVIAELAAAHLAELERVAGSMAISQGVLEQLSSEFVDTLPGEWDESFEGRKASGDDMV